MIFSIQTLILDILCIWFLIVSHIWSPLCILVKLPKLSLFVLEIWDQPPFDNLIVKTSPFSKTSFANGSHKEVQVFFVQSLVNKTHVLTGVAIAVPVKCTRGFTEDQTCMARIAVSSNQKSVIFASFIHAQTHTELKTRFHQRLIIFALKPPSPYPIHKKQI